MIPLLTSPYDIAMHIVAVSAWISFGFAIGAFHFMTLRWAVDLLVVCRPTSALAMVAPLARFAVTAGALIVAGRYFGAMALLSSSAGIFMARTAVLRVRACR